MKRDLKALIGQMTLEEKASLCSGSDFWHTQGIERLGIPAVMVTDGPHGLRKQAGEADHLGLNDSVEAVCFPAGCATGSSFDPDLLEHMGQVLGDECQAEDVSILLGPAVNIKRSPLCGRNFEYISEDPYLAGKLSAAYIRGVQSRGVGTSIKHFAANNQETRRLTISSDLSERALHEIYLPAFEEAVKAAQPKTVMCSYNKINGVYASENKMLLTDILRDQWGFEGYVVSDWGAANDRVKGLEAGLDLEMPSSNGYNDAKIVAAVQNGSLDEAVLDRAVERILKVVFSYVDARRPDTVFDRAKGPRRGRCRRDAVRGTADQSGCFAAGHGSEDRLHRRVCRGTALSGRRLQPHPSQPRDLRVGGCAAKGPQRLLRQGLLGDAGRDDRRRVGRGHSGGTKTPMSPLSLPVCPNRLSLKGMTALRWSCPPARIA